MNNKLFIARDSDVIFATTHNTGSKYGNAALARGIIPRDVDR